MARSVGSRVALVVLGVVAAGTVTIVVHDLLAAPERPTWDPVVRETALDARAAPAPPPGSSVSCGAPARRWIVLAWDGASWDLLLPLLDAGRLPNLAALIDRGIHGNVQGFRPSLSPALWTTVATGVAPDAHGIPGFVQPRHPLVQRFERIVHLGDPPRRLLTSADRRRPAIWNLLAEAGRSSLVVGWHNTHPVEEIEGMMVSNWLVRDEMRDQLRADPDAELSRALVWPPARLDEVLALERAARARLPAELPRFARLGPDALEAAVAGRSPSSSSPEVTRLHFLRQAWLVDAFHMEVARSFYPVVDPDLMLLHLQSIDWASHHFLVFHAPELYASMGWGEEAVAALARERERWRETVTAFYQRADTWLGEWMARAGPDTAILVLSDHGFEAEDDPGRGGQHHEAPPGIFVMAGPGIVSGVRLPDATLYDVLPTLLASLGLPHPADVRGQVLESAFCPGAREALVLATTSPPPDRWVPPIAIPEEVETDVVDELRSLGYVR